MGEYNLPPHLVLYRGTTTLVLNDIAKPFYDVTTATERHNASAAILHQLKKTGTHSIAVPADLYVYTKRLKVAGKTEPRDKTTGTIKLTLHPQSTSSTYHPHAGGSPHGDGKHDVHHRRPDLAASHRRSS